MSCQEIIVKPDEGVLAKLREQVIVCAPKPPEDAFTPADVTGMFAYYETLDVDVDIDKLGTSTPPRIESWNNRNHDPIGNSLNDFGGRGSSTSSPPHWESDPVSDGKPAIRIFSNSSGNTFNVLETLNWRTEANVDHPISQPFWVFEVLRFTVDSIMFWDPQSTVDDSGPRCFQSSGGNIQIRYFTNGVQDTGTNLGALLSTNTWYIIGVRYQGADTITRIKTKGNDTTVHNSPITDTAAMDSLRVGFDNFIVTRSHYVRFLGVIEGDPATSELEQLESYLESTYMP